MQRATYCVGDRVVLKTANDGGVACRISAVLPSAYGQVQYRIRFENETFERRIVQADIDPQRSVRSAPQETAVSPKAGSSWLNPSAMKIGK